MDILAKTLIYSYNLKDIWALPEGYYTVTFDDQSIEMTHAHIQMSWYYWIMYRYFPGAPLLSKYALTGIYDANSEKMGGALLWHIHNYHEANGSDICPVWKISKLIYEITNAIYNASCIELSEYVTSGSLYDLIEILEEPSIVEAKANYKQVIEETNYEETATEAAITATHKVISDVLYTNPYHLRNNGFKKLTVGGLVSKGQMMQLIGPIGYRNEIDNTVFPIPIDNGYGEGIPDLYSAMIDSRSAARSKLMQEAPLQNSEYFNRKIQLAATVIRDWVYIEGGCKDFVTIPYLVTSEDLVTLKGKYHMVDGKPILLWDNIEPLIDQIIEIRSITGCGCHNVQYVCQICLGWTWHIIPPNGNLGFRLATKICAIISQLILSTKHYQGSASSIPIKLNKFSSAWVKIDKNNPGKLFLHENKCKGNILIKVNSNYVKLLSQINHVNVSELAPERITRIPDLGITYVDDEGSMLGIFDLFDLEVSGMGVSLTTDVLQYLKINGWNSGKNYIEFTLTNWDHRKPIFIIPRKGDNIMTFFNEVRMFLEGGEKAQATITEYKTRAAVITELIDILRRRLNAETKQYFNFTQVEILVRALMMVSFKDKIYRLPHPKEEFVFENIKRVISNRSLTSSLAFQEQFNSILKPQWTRPELQESAHLLDKILG